jgi:hypothetical protein
MVKLGSDVQSFNFYVKAQIKSLSARGETCSDLLITLFKGYKAANNVELFDFLRRKENSYEEGEDVSASLMADALIKFKARKLMGKWSAPTKEQGQILALTVRLELLDKAVAPKKTPNESKPKGPKKDNKWAWKHVLPKEGDTKIKQLGARCITPTAPTI